MKYPLAPFERHEWKISLWVAKPSVLMLTPSPAPGLWVAVLPRELRQQDWPLNIYNLLARMTRSFEQKWAETFRYVAARSPFYREQFRSVTDVPSIENVKTINQRVLAET